MIQSFQIRNIGTYDAAGISCDNLEKVNFIYGANGSGKTTISKLLSNPQSNCTISWLDNRALETLVYNKNFKEKNLLHSSFEGVFTIGEEDIDNERKIIAEKAKLDKLMVNIRRYTVTLESKQGALRALEEEKIEAVWNNSTLINHEILRSSLTGFLGKKTAFFQKNLQGLSDNTPVLALEELESIATSIFHDNTSAISNIQNISPESLFRIENNAIWTEVIIGKNDVGISNLIEHLKISDWVNAGVAYIQENDSTCPFCQKETIDNEFKESIENYFDATYTENSALVDRLLTDYVSESNTIKSLLDRIVSIHEQPVPYSFDIGLFKQISAQLKIKLDLNLNIMRDKSQELSRSLDVHTTSEEIEALQAIIANSNDAILSHNNLVATLSDSKARLKQQVWHYTVNANKAILDEYNSKKSQLVKTITAIKKGIGVAESRIEGIEQELAALSQIPTNTVSTVHDINASLLSFGFTGFSIQPVDENRYQLHRSDGTLAKDTLSEGEVTFITFLYFYHLCKGGRTESSINTDRVIVIDDPISSLDSNILFVVSSLVKEIIKNVKNDDNHRFKQLIILTHNIYFHKEISFVNGQAQSENTVNFWKLRKSENKTSITNYQNKNPIYSSYEMLWRELKENIGSPIAIQNSMRRIIENYFRILGSMGDDDILSKFTCPNERLICKSLMCWVNDGSHCIPDDLFIDGQFASVDEYNRIFEAIFEKTGHISHYNMMMRNTDNNITQTAV
ncbi:AAA family ATPase [uncultured Psychrobacter sp.]|uniref:AAA family ATPase n=1 Tax=uncultured Psychrobacter sp. TaxID=259303 RepID=UPI003459E090